MSISFDFSEVDALKADLSKAPASIVPFAVKAVEVSARRTKDTAKRNVGGMRKLQHVPATIDYDKRDGGLTVEVGFNKAGQGNLGNIIEYGSRYFGARQPLARALHENEADFVKGMELAALDALKGLS